MNDFKISFECSDLIEEIKADIAEFGASTSAFGIYRTVKVKVPFSEKSVETTILVDYLMDTDIPLKKEELGDDTAITSDLGTLLKIFEKENEIE